jgi:hypothetical protein
MKKRGATRSPDQLDLFGGELPPAASKPGATPTIRKRYSIYLPSVGSFAYTGAGTVLGWLLQNSPPFIAALKDRDLVNCLLALLCVSFGLWILRTLWKLARKIFRYDEFSSANFRVPFRSLAVAIHLIECLIAVLLIVGSFWLAVAIGRKPATRFYWHSIETLSDYKRANDWHNGTTVKREK